MKKLLASLLAIAMIAALILSGCSPAPAPEPAAPEPAAPTPAAPAPAAPEPAAPDAIKMYFFTNGTRTDGTWSQNIYEAYEYITEKYPEVETRFTDLVPFADEGSYITVAGEEGVDLVYVDGSFSWYDAFLEYAPRYPDTWFINANLSPAEFETWPDNVKSYNMEEHQAGFLAGVAMGLMTETNKIGYVGGLPYPTIIRVGCGYEMGAKWINPDVEFSPTYTASWVDVEKAYEHATALIGSGADVLCHYSDNGGFGVIKACQESGAYFVGEARDQYEYAPDVALTSFLTNHPLMAETALLEYKAGTIEHSVTEVYLGGEYDWPFIAPLTNVPAEVVSTVEEAKQLIADGTIVVPYISDGDKIGNLSLDELGIPTAAELGVE